MIYLQLLYNLDSYIQCEKCSNKQKEKKSEIRQYRISYHRDSVFGTLITQKSCIVHAWTQVWALVEHLGTDFTLQLWREGEGTFGTWKFKSPFSDPSQGNSIENHQQTPPKEWSMSSANVWSSSSGTTNQINQVEKKPALNDRPGPSSRQNPHQGHSQPFVGVEGSDNEMIITCTNTDSDNIADLINPQHVVST